MGKWNQTSATQHEAFQRCQRYWYFGWIDRLPRGTTVAQQRGTDIHAEAEWYLNNDKFRDKIYTYNMGTDEQPDLVEINHRPYIEALSEHLPVPKPRNKDLISEQKLNMQIGPGMPRWLGFVDVGCSAGDPLRIIDIKTTSDFRYMKTEGELYTNIQVISYAKWVYEQFDYDGIIDVGLLYVKTNARTVPKKPKTALVNVYVDKAEVEDVWQRELEVIREMKHISETVKAAHDLEPTVTACGMFGGCPFQKECGIASDLVGSLFGVNKKKKENGKMSDFLKNLKKSAAAKKKNGTSTTNGVKAVETKAEEEPKKKKFKPLKKKEKVEAKEATILPPDAPSRETTDEESEVIQGEAQARAEKKEKKKTATKRKSFTIYVDCTPEKFSGKFPVLFEDWFQPIYESLNETAKEKGGKDSFWLLTFGEQKALVLSGVAEAAKEDLPNAMIVRKNTPGAMDALGALLPHATHVIQGTR